MCRNAAKRSSSVPNERSDPTASQPAERRHTQNRRCGLLGRGGPLGERKGCVAMRRSVPRQYRTNDQIVRQANLLSGGTPKTDVAAYWDGEVPWASAKDVSQCGEAFLVSTERTIRSYGKPTC